MNAQMKKDLESVVNSVINEDTDKAISSFKAYLKEKTKEILESGDFEGDRSRFEDDDDDSDEGDLDRAIPPSDDEDDFDYTDDDDDLEAEYRSSGEDDDYDGRLDQY